MDEAPSIKLTPTVEGSPPQKVIAKWVDNNWVVRFSGDEVNPITPRQIASLHKSIDFQYKVKMNNFRRSFRQASAKNGAVVE